MLTIFPQQINFLSDDTEAKLVMVMPVSRIVKEIFGVYEYTKAKHLLGTNINLPLPQIEKLLSSNLITVK